MSWVTIIWSMIASACITLGVIHLLIWMTRRTSWASFFFSLASLSTAALALGELWLMQTQTPEACHAALRWLHVPIWVMILSLVGFVRSHLQAGRPWLAWSVGVLRSASLLVNLLAEQNLNYHQIAGMRQIPFLGEMVTVAEGMVNPWMLLGQGSSWLFVMFVADATIAAWRRGDRREALFGGGSILLFSVAATLYSFLVLNGFLNWPVSVSFFYLCMVVAMGYELSRGVLRATQLSDDLRESEARMTMAAEAAELGVWIWNIERDEIWATEKWRRLFGFEADGTVRYEGVLERVHPDDRAPLDLAVRRAVERRGEYVGEYRVILPDGTQRWISARGRIHTGAQAQPVRMVGISIDITSRKQSELKIAEQRDELAHLSRVTMLGELSGSLAHELNQPLAAILSNAQAAQRFVEQDQIDLEEVREILKDIVEDDRRAGEIIRRLRLLLKKGELELQTLDANEVVRDVLRLVNSDLMNRGVTVHA